MVSSIKWLWEYSTGFRIRLLIIILLSIGCVCASLAFVESTKVFINEAVEGKNLIAIMIAILIGLKVIQLVCEQGEIYLRSLTRVKLENSLELRMFCALSDSKIQPNKDFIPEMRYTGFPAMSGWWQKV